MTRRWRILPTLVLLWSTAVNALDAVDTAQSEAMIDLLERCRQGAEWPAAIEQVMGLPGTQLVIAQQSISRRITAAQYRTTVASLPACNRRNPGARAEKGVEGLIADVAPSLLWGLRRAMSGGMSEQEHQAAVAEFSGEGYHATGAWMLNVILGVQGKGGVFKVMREPAEFLTVYNLCAAKLNKLFRFDSHLAKDLEHLERPH